MRPFSISYKLSKTFRTVDVNNLSVTDEMSLRYDLFLGSVWLRTIRTEICFDWDWIPLLDFAVSLSNICHSLLEKYKGEEELDFTESDEKIRFQKKGSLLRIISTSSEKVIEVGFQDFHDGVEMFYEDLFNNLLDKNEALKNNTIFMGYLNKALGDK